MAISLELNRTIVRTCRSAGVRELSRHDAGHAVDTVFAGLSPRSRYLRFHAPVPRLPAVVRDRLVAVDGIGHIAFVAEAPGVDGPVPVGIARVIRNAARPGRADIAVAVVDDWQRCGVGTRLLTELVAVAERRGVRLLQGDVLAENVAIIALARRVAPATRVRFADGTAQLDIPLGPDAWTVTHEDLVASMT